MQASKNSAFKNKGKKSNKMGDILIKIKQNDLSTEQEHLTYQDTFFLYIYIFKLVWPHPDSLNYILDSYVVV